MKGAVGWLVLLIALNLLLEILQVWGVEIGDIITLVLVAIIGIILVAAKKTK